MSHVFFRVRRRTTLSAIVTTAFLGGIPQSAPDDFDCIDPRGERMCIGGLTGQTTVGELAGALGIDIGPQRACTVDGRMVDPAHYLVDSEVVHGSRIGTTGAPVPTEPIALMATWITGPDAGRTVALSVGTHVIGRSRGAMIRCDDLALELHHAHLEVRADNSSRLTQLGGRVDIAVDGSAVQGQSWVVPGQRLAVGSSVLELRRPDEPYRDVARRPPSHGGAWRFPFVRVPRAILTFEAVPLAAPRPPTTTAMGGGGLVPAMLGLVGAVGVALLLGQLMFLVFGAMGAVVALGTWGAQRLGIVRSRKGARRAYDAAVTRFTDALGAQQTQARSAHSASTPTIDSAVQAMTSCSAALWAVRASDPGAFRVSLGVGEAGWAPQVTGTDGDTPANVWTTIESASRLIDVPVAASLGDKCVIAVVGSPNEAAAVARSMVVQLAASSGPADWQLGIVVDGRHEWDGLSWLRHVEDSRGLCRIVGPEDAGSFVADLDSADERMLVFVTDRADLLAARTSPLRRLLASRRRVAGLLICPTMDSVPAVVSSVLALGRNGEARWTADTRVAALPVVVRYAGISGAGARDAAAAIAHLIDPEVADDAAGLPVQLGIVELLVGGLHCGDDPDRSVSAMAMAIAALWRSNGSDPAPSSPIGMAADGVVEIDLAADGPHGLIAGTTGAGKSELLRSLVIGLATRLSPDQITFVLVDYKGGSTFDECVDLPHVVGVVTDLDEHLATRALRSLEAELRRRERQLRDVGAPDLTSYRGLDPVITRQRRALPRLVVVIDEFATLAVQQPQFIGALLGIAQRGRSLGVHLLLATQRPSGVISDDIRANTNLRIALRVQDASDSADVLGVVDAALLTRRIPGRAIMRLGTDEHVTFQTAQCTRANQGEGEHGLRVRRFATPAADRPAVSDAATSELGLLVQSVCAAAELIGIEPPHRPWLPPLPTVFDADSCSSKSLGLVDDPDEQRQVPLEWTPQCGHLFVVGASGMGVTSALLTIASRVAVDDSNTEIFVIDAMGDVRLKLLEALPACRGVVGVHERERLMRLCSKVDVARNARKDGALDASLRGAIVLFIDGMGALRSELEAAELFDQLEQLDNIVSQGQSVGITVVVTASHPGAMPMQMMSHFANRWVMHLADPFDAAMLGVSSTLVPGATAGRMFDARSGLEAQIGLFDATALAHSPTGSPRLAAYELGVLADDIDVASLSSPTASADDVEIPCAVAYSTLLPVSLRIAGGEHVLVLGPYRSGRSTALATLVRGWQSVEATGWVASVAPRRTSARHGFVFEHLASLLEHLPDERRALIVVDDAELVDDPTGALGALIASRRAEVTVLCAGRPEALRSAYGHWTSAVRRSRLGVLMSACSDIDGDLLNVVLPRRLPIAARPGLGWIVAEGDKQFAQIARVGVASCEAIAVDST